MRTSIIIIALFILTGIVRTAVAKDQHIHKCCKKLHKKEKKHHKKKHSKRLVVTIK